MNISLNWLSEYVDVTLPADQLGELFTRIGLNCEGIADAGDDIVFDLEVTSNRPDCLGHLGVARELAAATGQRFRKPTIELPSPTGKVEDFTAVQVDCPDLCPRYTARVIRNVRVAASPAWLVNYLEAVGLRSINNVVDVTNFVLMEYSQPLHSFDQDRLQEGRIVVRRGRAGEKLVAIDETTCELNDTMCVIADAADPVAIAGIMGGLNSEVTEATKNVLLESAQFNPLATRQTSRSLGILSESNYRFERGVDPVGLDEASRRACQLICELAGGELADGVVDVWAKPYQPATVTLRPQRTALLLGIDVPVEKQLDVLDRLGLEPTLQDATITCTIPPHRKDLCREADLIEEVARMVGYDAIPTLNRVSHPVRAMGRAERLRRTASETMTAAGYDEAITFSFIDAEESNLFGIDQPVTVDRNVRRTNNALRPTLLASLLKAAKTNQDVGNEQVSLFELSAVFPPGSSANDLPQEYTQLALVSTEGLRDVRGAVEAVVERLAPQSHLDVASCDDQPFEQLLLDGESIGQIGLVGPPKGQSIQKHYGLEKPLAAAELRFDKLAEKARLVRTTHALPKFPPVRRDLSLIVDEPVTWAELIDAINACPQELRVDTQYVTTYRGKPIAKGKKSMTVSLEYRSAEGTLTSEQVDQQVQQVFEAIKSKISAELRTQ